VSIESAGVSGKASVLEPCEVGSLSVISVECVIPSCILDRYSAKKCFVPGWYFIPKSNWLRSVSHL